LDCEPVLASLQHAVAVGPTARPPVSRSRTDSVAMAVEMGVGGYPGRPRAMVVNDEMSKLRDTGARIRWSLPWLRRFSGLPRRWPAS